MRLVSNSSDNKLSLDDHFSSDFKKGGKKKSKAKEDGDETCDTTLSLWSDDSPSRSKGEIEKKKKKSKRKIKSKKEKDGSKRGSAYFDEDAHSVQSSFSRHSRKSKRKSKSRSGSLGPLSKSKRKEKGYDSDGVLGSAKAKARAAREERRESRRAERRSKKESVPKRNKSTGALDQRRQNILNDLNMLDNQGAITNSFLQSQVEALEKQVAKLVLEKDEIQSQLYDEIEKGDELQYSLDECQAKVRSFKEGGEDVEKLKALLAEEKIQCIRELQEKDQCIDDLKQSISEMLADKEKTNPSEKDKQALLAERATVTILEEKIAIQKRKIDELSSATNGNVSMSDDAKSLSLQVERTKAENTRLKVEIKNLQKEHEAAMQRKDESIVFFHNELTRLKQAPPTLLSPHPSQNSTRNGVNPYLSSSKSTGDQHKALGSGLRQSFNNLSKLVSPFTAGKEGVSVPSSGKGLLAPL